MTNEEHIAQARAQIEALQLSEKCKTFLLKALDVTMDKPIHSIDVVKAWSGAKFSVFYEDGDERQFEAQPPKPKRE